MNSPVERGIIFTRASVEAIAAGRKTQTRRMMTSSRAPYQPGDRLYVKETWGVRMYTLTVQEHPHLYLAYRSSKVGQEVEFGDWRYEKLLELAKYKRDLTRWRCPRFMPKWAARLWLEVTAVRTERLHDISLEDICAEGVEAEGGDLRERWRELWDSINARRGYHWASNPWVWVITFRRI